MYPFMLQMKMLPGEPSARQLAFAETMNCHLTIVLNTLLALTIHIFFHLQPNIRYLPASLYYCGARLLELLGCVTQIDLHSLALLHLGLILRDLRSLLDRQLLDLINALFLVHDR